MSHCPTLYGCSPPQIIAIKNVNIKCTFNMFRSIELSEHSSTRKIAEEHSSADVHKHCYQLPKVPEDYDIIQFIIPTMSSLILLMSLKIHTYDIIWFTMSTVMQSVLWPEVPTGKPGVNLGPTVCGVNYQLLIVMPLKYPNGQLLVAVDHCKLWTIVSETPTFYRQFPLFAKCMMNMRATNQECIERDSIPWPSEYQATALPMRPLGE